MVHKYTAIKLITFTGASGVGKTVIARTLLERFPLFGWLESITTREIRPTNFPDEYVHVSQGEFLQWVSEEKFVEWVQVHGNDYYGTLKGSLDRVLTDPKRIYLKTIDPVGLAKIHAYAPSALLPFYVLAPSEDILRQRLSDRGESEETVQRRLHDCERWDADARQSKIPYVFIQNEKTIEDVIEHIIDFLSGRGVI
ncbi:MAG: hypothetical protein AAB400_02295 [Patescibacteria group bacterium]